MFLVIYSLVTKFKSSKPIIFRKKFFNTTTALTRGYEDIEVQTVLRQRIRILGFRDEMHEQQILGVVVAFALHTGRCVFGGVPHVIPGGQGVYGGGCEPQNVQRRSGVGYPQEGPDFLRPDQRYLRADDGPLAGDVDPEGVFGERRAQS